MRYIYRVLLLTFIPQVFVFSLLLLKMLDFNNIDLENHTVAITLVLGIPALIIAIITLVLAISIQKNNVKSIKQNEQERKNAFEHSLREFFVYFMLVMSNSPIDMVKTVNNSLVYLKDLKTNFINYTSTDRFSSSYLAQIEITLNDLLETEMTSPDFPRYVDGIKDRLISIGEKHHFDPSKV